MTFKRFTDPHKQIIVEKLHEVIGTALVEASLCWDKPPTGVFDSTRAKDVLYRTVAGVLKIMNEES